MPRLLVRSPDPRHSSYTCPPMSDRSLHTPELQQPLHEIGYVLVALIVTVPGVFVRLAGIHPSPILAAFLYGIAVVGAAFMLSWAAEVIQLDISAGFALALLALIAILPEYAVDFVFTSKAGRSFAETGSAGPDGVRALANMTGGNQLLIGLGWPAVVLLGTWRVRKLRVAPEESESATADAVHLERSHSVEIAFLALASLYGLTLFLKHTLTLFDAAVLVALYLWYLFRIAKAPPEAPHLVGPSAYIGALPKRARRWTNYSMFVLAAAVIVVVAEPFAESIIEMGEAIGVSDFLLVKWIAPTASEAPELLVATLFAWRLASQTGLGALISSKVNQWTLLVGTLPIVFAIFGNTRQGLPLNQIQRDELLVTAAQSVFAVAVITSFSMNRREAWVMFGLFISQLTESGLAEAGVISEQVSAQARVTVAIAFLAAAGWFIRHDARRLPAIMRDGLFTPYSELATRERDVAGGGSPGH